MIVLPAVDLLDGKVVRLAQGQRNQVTVYSDDPVGIAKRWVDAGATWLHVVDLNGAFDGVYTNLSVAQQIIKSCRISIELSGGIRSKETFLKALDIGAARVVLGTVACEDPGFVLEIADRFSQKVAVAIDAKAGQVVSRGWVSATPLTPVALARSVVMLGVETLICTDVSRDGMMQGPNLSLLSEVLGVGPKRLIASGGIASLNDLRQLKPLEAKGLTGAIVGKALYERALDLKEAIRLLGGHHSAIGTT